MCSGINKGHNLIDQTFRKVDAGEGLSEMLGKDVDMLTAEIEGGDQVSVGIPKAGGIVGFSTTKDVGHEGFLPFLLLRHIDVSKEMADAIIIKDTSIEVIDSEADGEFSPKSLVKACHRDRLGGVCLELRGFWTEINSQLSRSPLKYVPFPRHPVSCLTLGRSPAPIQVP